MTARSLIAWLLCLSAFGAQAASLWDEPLIERIDDQDSLPDDNVTALAEDHRGLLWIGTPNGLFRYDGYRLQRHIPQRDNPGALAGGFVRALLVDRDGRLWVGSNSDGISILDPGSEHFRHLRRDGPLGRSLPDDSVRALAQDRDGSIWIGTLGGLARWDRDSGQIETLAADGSDQGPADNRIFGLAADADGTLWIGSWGGLDRRRAGDTGFERVPLLPALPGRSQEPSVRAIFPAKDGSLWLGTLDAEILALAGHGQIPRRVDMETRDGQREPTTLMLLTAAAAGDDEIWLGGLGGVLSCKLATARCRQPVLYDPNVPHGLGSSDIRALLRDRAGHLWLGGYSSGLQRINADNRALRMLRFRPQDPLGLSDASIAAVHAGSDGRLYLGTRGRGVDVLDPEQGVVTRIPPRPETPDGLQNGVVTALTRAPGGELWIGTDYGLARIGLPSQRGRRYLREQGLPSNTIRRLLLDGQQRLWIGTNQGLALLPTPDSPIEVLGDAQGQPVVADINAIVQSAEGRMWVGSIRGLYRIDPGERVLHAVTNPAGGGPAQEAILGLLLDREQRLWLDTPRGLFRMSEHDGQPTRFEFISAQRGIDGQPFGANLLQDEQGRIWSHRFVYDPAVRQVYELTRADGADLGTGWFRAYDKDAQGTMYFGGSKGLLRIEPALFTRWSYAAPLVITGLSIDGRSASVDAAGVVLDSGARQLAVEFAALDYSAPHRLRYAYRLEGHDLDWIDSEPSRRVASYGNLWPGRYTLRVRGSDRTGQWSRHEIALPVEVQPLLWQTRSFQVLSAVALLAVGWLLAHLYARRLRSRARLLQQLVDGRTADLSQAKSRAEGALADLRETQQQLLEAEKAAALGRLVAGVAHEINTPIGIALTAVSMLRARGYQMRGALDGGALRKSDLRQFLDVALEASELVENSLDRTAQLVQTFKTVAVEADHEPRRRFDLDESLASLCRGLSASWEAAGIRHTLNCPRHLEMDSYPGTLGQVLLALADNVVHHAFDDGYDKSLTISAEADGAHQVRIVVADNGRGIPAEALGRIFEPFYTTRRAQGSTGLGLHVVYKRVGIRLGGSISASCPPQGGTRFELILPRTAPAVGAIVGAAVPDA